MSRFATLAHTIAIVSTVTTEKIARIRLPCVETMLLPPAVAEYGTSLTLIFWFSSGWARCSCAQIVESSDCALDSETPGARRPNIATATPDRFGCSHCRNSPASGTQMSAISASQAPRNCGSTTPTMVAGWPLTATLCPTMLSIPPKAFCHT